MVVEMEPSGSVLLPAESTVVILHLTGQGLIGGLATLGGLPPVSAEHIERLTDQRTNLSVHADDAGAVR